jgi:hypothetical protein
MKCNVCSQKNDTSEQLIYRSQGKSLSSLALELNFGVEVYYCTCCSHVFSNAEIDLDEYYDKDYEILTDSEEEDQIYRILDGKIVFRTQHQLTTLLREVQFKPKMKILDYGCAKSSMMKYLLGQDQTLDIHLFDVSDRYTSFWDAFLSSDKYATYEVPNEWYGKMNLVTSFFSLEHVASPIEFIRNVKKLLAFEGIFYGIVPYYLTNPGDLIVSDHINHFTEASLYKLLADCGFKDISINTSIHRGAFVFKCVKDDSKVEKESNFANIKEETVEMGKMWQDIKHNIHQLCLQLDSTTRVAIYGAGFYGSFIKSCLSPNINVECIYDSNPYLEGKSVSKIPVVHSKSFDSSLDYLLVGLNPKNSRNIIESMDWIHQSNVKIFYI